MTLSTSSKTLKAGSLFSGIGGFDLGFQRAGIEIAWMCERDEKAKGVLARNFPGVPIYDDVKDLKGADVQSVDILMGGFPCQDVSVAGRRAGLAGERSGLWFEFERIIREVLPKWVVVENVPGLLSSNKSKDIQIIIDTLTQIGYTVDIDIRDAQFFGVAQRRRRVFLTCVRLDVLLKQKTSLSRQISTDLAVQQLLDIWGAIPPASSLVQLHSVYEKPIARCLASLRKRTGLLDVTRERLASSELRNNWDVLRVPFTEEVKNSVSGSIEKNEQHDPRLRARDMCESLWKKATGEDGRLSISMWLNNLSDAVCAQESKSTTSTSTLPITDSTIFTFAAAALNIIAPMLHSLDWSADCLNVAQSALTLLQENMNYARQASNYLFIEARLRDGWRDYLSAASDLQSELEFRIRDGRAAQVLFERESGGGNPAPRRETRQGAAADAGASTPDRRDGGSGSPENNPVLAGTLSASGAGTARTGNSYSERDMLIPVAIDAIDVRNSRGQGGVSGTLQSKSTGGYSLNYINPIAVIKGAAVGREPENGPQYGEVITDGSVYTLNTSETHVVAFTQNQREEVRDLNGVAGALAADAGAHQTNYVAFGLSTFETPKFAEELSPTVVTPSPTGGGQPPAVAIAFDRSKPQWLEEQTGVLRVSGSVTEGVSPGKADYWCATTQTGVRRLTPTECERLQGFPDGHTDGQSDSTRYRQLGNAVCVNVAEWIGKRIVAAEGGA